MLRILVEQAGEVIDDALFDKRVVSIGRDLRNDVVLRDNRVSSVHLVLKQVENEPRFRVLEQGWNGVLINGAPASNNDVIERPTVIVIAGYEMTLVPLEPHEETVEVGRTDFARTSELGKIPAAAPPEATSRARGAFEIVGADGVKSTVEFSETALIGRTRDCDIRIDSSDVSRQHCQVYYTGSGFRIRRLSTINGLDVNGRPLAPGESSLLGDGDVIRICSFVLTLRLSPHGDERAAVIDAAPNLNLTIQRRQSSRDGTFILELVGFLGSKTYARFEREVLQLIRKNHDVIIDFGYLIGIDASGIGSLSRIFAEASRSSAATRLVRCTPRIVDLLEKSSLGHEILPHVSRTEESAVRSLRR